MVAEWSHLVKRRRALLESNSPRNSQVETHPNDEAGARAVLVRALAFEQIGG